MAERAHCLYRVSTITQVDHGELNRADIPVRRKACREFAGKMGRKSEVTHHKLLQLRYTVQPIFMAALEKSSALPHIWGSTPNVRESA